MRHNKFLNLYTFAQATSYLVAGVFLTTSHNLQNVLSLRYFGHLLIAASFLTLLSTFNYKWSRRLASFDIFSAALDIITFAALLFGVLDEFLLQSQNKASLPTMGESSTIAILLIIYFWLFAFIIIEAVSSSRHRALRVSNRSWRGWRQFLNWIFCLLGVMFFLAGILSAITQAFPPSYFWGPSFSFFIYRLVFAD